MHFALVIDDYLPDSTRAGAKMFHELAVELKSRGYNITIITPGVEFQKKRLTFDEIDGIHVWRFKSGPVKDVSKSLRAINETLLSFNAWCAVAQHVGKNTFNGVIYYSPSIFFGHLVKKLKAACRCPSYLILRDFFPQWAIDAGIISENSIVTRYFRLFEKLNYDAADFIGVMSPANLTIFKDKHRRKYDAHILYNWAKLAPVHQLQCGFREKFSLEDKTIFFYGGNIGRAQDMTNLVRLAKNMKKHSEAHFLFVGQGDEFPLVEKLKKEWELDNLTLAPSVSQDEFKLLLAEVDIGLFSLAKNHTAHNFPGKLLGYMVEALPILGSVNAGNDLLELINNSRAGFVFINGEDDKLLETAELLCSSQKERRQRGKNAVMLLEKTFSVRSAADTILNKLAGH